MSLFSKNKSTASGFSLVEVVVSTGIVVAILTVILLNQSTYTSGSTLANLVDSIGLSISEAQTYGVSVKEVTPGSNEFNYAYGVEFNIVTNSGSQDAYISFTDKNDNGLYDNSWACGVGPISECLSKTNLPLGYLVSDICEIPMSGDEVCGQGKVDISFRRPNTDAKIYFFDHLGSPVTFPISKGVKIKIISPKGITASIMVYNTGQVSVQ